MAMHCAALSERLICFNNCTLTCQGFSMFSAAPDVQGQMKPRTSWSCWKCWQAKVLIEMRFYPTFTTFSLDNVLLTVEASSVSMVFSSIGVNSNYVLCPQVWTTSSLVFPTELVRWVTGSANLICHLYVHTRIMIWSISAFLAVSTPSLVGFWGTSPSSTLISCCKGLKALFCNMS